MRVFCMLLQKLLCGAYTELTMNVQEELCTLSLPACMHLESFCLLLQLHFVSCSHTYHTKLQKKAVHALITCMLASWVSACCCRALICRPNPLTSASFCCKWVKKIPFVTHCRLRFLVFYLDNSALCCIPVQGLAPHCHIAVRGLIYMRVRLPFKDALLTTPSVCENPLVHQQGVHGIRKEQIDDDAN